MEQFVSENVRRRIIHFNLQPLGRAGKSETTQLQKNVHPFNLYVHDYTGWNVSFASHFAIICHLMFIDLLFNQHSEWIMSRNVVTTYFSALPNVLISIVSPLIPLKVTPILRMQNKQTASVRNCVEWPPRPFPLQDWTLPLRCLH